MTLLALLLLEPWRCLKSVPSVLPAAPVSLVARLVLRAEQNCQKPMGKNKPASLPEFGTWTSLQQKLFLPPSTFHPKFVLLELMHKLKALSECTKEGGGRVWQSRCRSSLGQPWVSCTACQRMEGLLEAVWEYLTALCWKLCWLIALEWLSMYFCFVCNC